MSAVSDIVLHYVKDNTQFVTITTTTYEVLANERDS